MRERCILTAQLGWLRRVNSLGINPRWPWMPVSNSCPPWGWETYLVWTWALPWRRPMGGRADWTDGRLPFRIWAMRVFASLCSMNLIRLFHMTVCRSSPKARLHWKGRGAAIPLVGSLRRNLPATVRLSWERHAMRNPGVVWLLRAEQNSYAPRPLIEITRRSGRGPLQASIGLGYGGWGGTYIPLSVRMPSRAVRQGRPGGTVHLTSRWLALAGTGGRMALGLNWHQSF